MKIFTYNDGFDHPGHYSPAAQMGNLVFISGQLPMDWGKKELPEGIEAQTNQALQNFEAALSSAGLRKEDVGKVTVLVTDIRFWPTVDVIYAKFFGAHKPARCVTPVSSLHYGALIEIEGVAERKEC